VTGGDAPVQSQRNFIATRRLTDNGSYLLERVGSWADGAATCPRVFHTIAVAAHKRKTAIVWQGAATLTSTVVEARLATPTAAVLRRRRTAIPAGEEAWFNHAGIVGVTALRHYICIHSNRDNRDNRDNYDGDR
jgi:hypothetical protein